MRAVSSFSVRDSGRQTHEWLAFRQPASQSRMARFALGGILAVRTLHGQTPLCGAGLRCRQKSCIHAMESRYFGGCVTGAAQAAKTWPMHRRKAHENRPFRVLPSRIRSSTLAQPGGRYGGEMPTRRFGKMPPGGGHGGAKSTFRPSILAFVLIRCPAESAAAIVARPPARTARNRHRSTSDLGPEDGLISPRGRPRTGSENLD